MSFIAYNEDLPYGRPTIDKCQHALTVGDFAPDVPERISKIIIYKSCSSWSMIFSEEFFIWLWQSNKSLYHLKNAITRWQYKTMNSGVTRSDSYLRQRARVLKNKGIILKELSSYWESRKKLAERHAAHVAEISSLNDLAGVCWRP